MMTTQAATPARPILSRAPVKRPEKEADAMWPVESLRSLLSPHLLAFEDCHLVELRCTRCGWTAVYSAAGVRADTLVLDAQAHRCLRKGGN